MPKVSVIMAVHNQEKLVIEAIESIINQTYKDWELVICDDASTDNTYRVISGYAERYENIRVFKNEENHHAAYTRNRCAEEAKGEYLAIMDSDDISMPERLEKQAKILDERPEISLVSTAAITFDENGDRAIRGMKGIEYPFRLPVSPNLPVVHATIMIRKKDFDAIGGYTVSQRTLRGEDLDLCFKIRVAKFEGYTMQEVLYRIRERKEDFKRRTVKDALGFVKTSKKYYKLLKVPRWKWYMMYKPVVSAMLPDWFMFLYHKLR
ncbi:MAG: glycosyltransferase family 2 protein [Clostridia bacterium]|nr:glycosyltransferase family 2 protein [Clostridia bacterium]